MGGRFAHATLRAAAMAALLSLTACVMYEPLAGVPKPFIESYPPGSQKRSILDLQATFAKRAPDYHELYEQALREDQDIGGEIVLALALTPDGRVADCQIIRSAMPSTQLEAWVLALTGQLEFGAAPGRGYYVFHYPLQFTRT